MLANTGDDIGTLCSASRVDMSGTYCGDGDGDGDGGCSGTRE